MDATSGATAHVQRYRTGKLSDTTNRARSGTPVKISVRPESPEDDPWDSIPAPNPARGGSPPEPYSRFGPSPPKKQTVPLSMTKTTVPMTTMTRSPLGIQINVAWWRPPSKTFW